MHTWGFQAHPCKHQQSLECHAQRGRKAKEQQEPSEWSTAELQQMASFAAVVVECQTASSGTQTQCSAAETASSAAAAAADSGRREREMTRREKTRIEKSTECQTPE
uniref:Uncharacterized protein n=1 Tax=Opuntia streptacantha TaxID=393608 RepID=A0A7C8Z4Z2_OPUST